MKFEPNKPIAVKRADEEWLQGLFDMWAKEAANGDHHMQCSRCPNHLIRYDGSYMVGCEATCSGTCHAFFRKFFKSQGFDTTDIWPDEFTDKQLCQGSGPAKAPIKIFIPDAYQMLLAQSKSVEMTESELDALLS